MRHTPVRPQKTNEAALAALGVMFIAGVVLSACATFESVLGPIGTSSESAATVSEGESALTAPAQASIDLDCPAVTVRSGASTWQVSTGSGPTNVRYQGSLGQLARECAILGEMMTMRVGVEGRVLVGPKGGPGSVDVPLRIALVAEGPQPKAIWNKFYSVPVTVPPNASMAIFSQVEDDLTFALPADRKIDHYVVYVGFDPQGAAAARAATKSKAPAPKAAPKAAAAPKVVPEPRPATTPPATQPKFEPPPSPPPGIFAPPPGHSG